MITTRSRLTSSWLKVLPPFLLQSFEFRGRFLSAMNESMHREDPQGELPSSLILKCITTKNFLTAILRVTYSRPRL